MNHAASFLKVVLSCLNEANFQANASLRWNKTLVEIGSGVCH